MPENTPKTFLTLSAEPELLPEDARSAAVIRRILAAIARARAGGVQRERLTDQLVDYVWPQGGSLRAERDPLTSRLERELAPIAESELRALAGDR